MKKTAWQILPKHLPARTEQHESIKLASALHLPTTVLRCWYLTAQRHPRKYQSKGCILATFPLVYNLTPSEPELEPWLHGVAPPPSCRVNKYSCLLGAGKWTRFLLRHCRALTAWYSRLYTLPHPIESVGWQSPLSHITPQLMATLIWVGKQNEWKPPGRHMATAGTHITFPQPSFSHRDALTPHWPRVTSTWALIIKRWSSLFVPVS